MEDEDPGYCGISTIWEDRRENSPFREACKRHDKFYVEHMKGILNEESTYIIDNIFWNDMQKEVDAASGLDKVRLKARQVVYYGVVRVVGKFRWPRIKGILVDKLEQ